MATTLHVPAEPVVRAAEFPKPFIGSIVLLLSDTLALAGAIGLGASTWAMMVNSAPIELATASVVVATAIIAYTAQGLYGFGMAETEQLRRLFATTTIVYLAMTAILFLSKHSTSQSRGVFVCSWALSIAFVPLLRAAVVARASRRSWWGRPTLIVGGGTAAERLVCLFKSHPALGIKPIAVVDNHTRERQVAGIPVVATMEEAESHAGGLGLRHAVVVEPGPGAQAVLDRCAAQFANVLVIPQLGAKTSLWVSPRDLAGTLGLELRQNLLIPFNRVLKRALDIAVTLCAAILAIPIVAMSAACIACVSPGSSPFFSQRRENFRGGFFRVYKLRTMHPHAEMMLLQYLERSDDAKAEWQKDFKLKSDPRVLPGIGTFLRRTSLDELPQLWNVLKGEMSVVGPRPIVSAEIERYGSTYNIVQRVKPGMTGLWQVSGRNDVSYTERVNLDAYYVRNWSIWLDITILVRTAQVLLCRKGAY